MSPSDIAYITRTAEKIALTVSLSINVYRPNDWTNRRVQTRPPSAITLKPTTFRSANSESGRFSMRRRAFIIRPAPNALLVVGKEPASISSSSNSNHPPANGQQSTSRVAKKASSLSNGNFQLSAVVVSALPCLQCSHRWYLYVRLLEDASLGSFQLHCVLRDQSVGSAFDRPLESSCHTSHRHRDCDWIRLLIEDEMTMWPNPFRT